MKGISAFVSLAFVILFGIIGMSVVIVVVTPALDQAKDSAVVNEALQNLDILDSNINEIASESKYSKRTISMASTDGTYKVDSGSDYLYFTYTPKTDLGISGSRGDVEIETGDDVFSDYFVKYDESSDASPIWTTVAGTWRVQSGKYNVVNGTAYHPVGLTKGKYYTLSANVTNVSGETGGEIVVLPGAINNLKGWWHFDEGSGRNLTYDYSGNKNNGTLTNINPYGNSTSGWTTSGKFGNALLFDGVNDIINVNNFNDVVTGNQITVSAWVNFNSLPASTKYLIQEGNTFAATIESNNKLRFVVLNTSGSTSPNTDSDAIQTGRWYHFIGTYDGSLVKVYLNGSLISSSSFLGNLQQSAGQYLTIGGNSSSGYEINGIIDEVKIYSRAMTAAEVSSEYTLGLKRLTSTGSITFTAPQNDINLTLSNPGGTSDFDDIVLSGGDQKQLRFVIPYSNIELQGSDHFSAGQNKVVIKHNGTNSTNNRPNIYVGK